MLPLVSCEEASPQRVLATDRASPAVVLLSVRGDQLKRFRIFLFAVVRIQGLVEVTWALLNWIPRLLGVALIQRR